MKTLAITALCLLALTAAGQDTDKAAPAVSDKATSKPEVPLKPIWYKAFGNFGEWWKNLSDAEKDSFIDGFTTAMEDAHFMNVEMCKGAVKEAQPGSADFNAKLYGGMTMCVLGERFDFKVDKPLKPALDDFYKDPLNARIPDKFAMDYVRDELQGKKTAGQLLDELNDWRKTLNH